MNKTGPAWAQQGRHKSGIPTIRFSECRVRGAPHSETLSPAKSPELTATTPTLQAKTPASRQRPDHGHPQQVQIFRGPPPWRQGPRPGPCPHPTGNIPKPHRRPPGRLAAGVVSYAKGGVCQCGHESRPACSGDGEGPPDTGLEMLMRRGPAKQGTGGDGSGREGAGQTWVPTSAHWWKEQPHRQADCACPQL